VITTLAATLADENGVVHLTGTYTDQGTQDTHTLTINWGDGTPQTVTLSAGSFDITHQYLDDNPTGTASDQYTIGVTLTDDDSGSVTGSTTTTITNVAPVITTLAATSADENGVVHLTGTYTDQGTQDTHTLTINWGDGTPQTVTLSGGSFDITHQYLNNNLTVTPSDQYTIGVTLTDDDTGSVAGSTTTTITNVAPGGAKSFHPSFPVTDAEPSPSVWTTSSVPLGASQQTSFAGTATTGPTGPEIGGLHAALTGVAAVGVTAGSSPEPELWSATAATPIATIEELVGLYGFAEQLGAGKVLVFNLDDFHYTDLCTDSVVFAQQPGATQLTGLAGYLAGVKAGKALVFNLDDIVSFDLLAA
jgi:hypothetical protein